MANHNEVAHAWAHQTGRQRRGFNMFYEGDTIYSYGHHFPIARLVTLADGSSAVLFTAKSYSVSTAKHKNYVRRAINHLPVFTVENVNARTPDQHVNNFDAMCATIAVSITTASRAIKNGQWYLDRASEAAANARAYIREFVPDLADVCCQRIPIAPVEVVAKCHARRELAETRERVQARKRELAQRDRLRQWLAGESVQPPHTRIPMVRVAGDRVQTTWGASVPFAEAQAVWRMMQEARRSGADVPVDGLRVGDFALTSITRLGLRVGCHFIPYRFAQIAARNAGLEG